ncbi:MAG TPA: PH domain-containing protein [Candidatus Saccharimonadales bacterium]
MQTFKGQYENEEVLLVFRRHLIAMRKGFYFFFVPFVLGAVPVLIWPDNLNNLWFPVIGALLGATGFFYHWMSWYFSVFIITNQRLRQVSQKGLFSRSIIDLGLNKIQNITVDVPGFNAAVLGFGTIVVQTYVGDLVLDRVEHPEKIYESLLDIVKTYAQGNVNTINETITQEDIIET